MAEILRFDGDGCGLGYRSESGDRNEPANYMLFCGSCHHELGPLGRFMANKDGIRSAFCPQCEHATCVKGTQVYALLTPDQVKQVIAQKARKAS